LNQAVKAPEIGQAGRRSALLRFGADLTVVEMVAVIVLALILVGAVAAPFVGPYSSSDQDLQNTLAAPGADGHLLGTDQLGRDLFSRLLDGAAVSLGIAIAVVASGLVVGTAVGATAGYRGGWIDSVLMRIMDALLAFPALVLALVIATGLGPNIRNTIIAIAVVMVPAFARVVRALTMQARERDYVLAARAAGASTTRILRVHILPNIWPPLSAQAVLALAYVVPAEAALSFVGLGVQQPTPSWGNMIADGYEFLSRSPWGLILPASAIVLTVASVSIVSDALNRRSEQS